MSSFASASRESPVRNAAERSLTELRTGRRPVDDFKNLRTEVMDLQKQNRDLKKQLETVEKKLDALATPKPAADSKRPATGKSTKGKPTQAPAPSPKNY